MNFGQGKLGLAFWPMAKSKPDPEYSTVLSAPIALDALSMTVLASCANAVDANSRTIRVTDFLNIVTSNVVTVTRTPPPNRWQWLPHTVFRPYLDRSADLHSRSGPACTPTIPFRFLNRTHGICDHSSRR